jgi:hypothetical protein
MSRMAFQGNVKTINDGTRNDPGFVVFAGYFRLEKFPNRV